MHCQLANPHTALTFYCFTCQHAFTVYVHVSLYASCVFLLYKSLFTENAVATRKHNSASINTHKARTTTRSITVVDTWYWSINKISYIIMFFLLFYAICAFVYYTIYVVKAASSDRYSCLSRSLPLLSLNTCAVLCVF